MRQALFKCETPRLKLKSSQTFLAIKRCERTKIGKVIKQSRSSKLRWAHICAHSCIPAKHRHRASTYSNRHQLDMPTPISGEYFIIKSLKKGSSCPNNNRGVTYQTDEKHLNNMAVYFVGVVNIVFNRYNNRFL
jgi:hypothetical protein